MKRILFLCFLLCSAFTSFAQATYSLKGNAFYKNNYLMQNAGDAGSEVWLYKLNDSTIKNKNTICDLTGSFEFKNLDTGKYFLIVKSNNTKTEPYFAYINLIIFSAYLNDIFGIDFNKIDPPLQSNLKNVHDTYMEYIRSDKVRLRKLDAFQLQMLKMVAQYFSEIPSSFTLKIDLTSFLNNYYFENINLNHEDKNIVIDFGQSESKI